MGNRTIERSTAKALYHEFSLKWKRELRLSGKYGKPGFRKPTFSQWHKMHMKDHEMMKESTPSDVQEFLGLDPWDPASEGTEHPIEQESENDIVTVPIVP